MSASKQFRAAPDDTRAFHTEKAGSIWTQRRKHVYVYMYIYTFRCFVLPSLIPAYICSRAELNS